MDEQKPDVFLDTLNKSTHHVHGELGPTHQESLYTAALMEDLKDAGFVVERESPVTPWFTTRAGKRRALPTLKVDLAVTEGSTQRLVEIKNLNPTPGNQESARCQVNSYVKFSGKRFKDAYIVFFPKSVDKRPAVFKVVA